MRLRSPLACQHTFSCRAVASKSILTHLFLSCGSKQVHLTPTPARHRNKMYDRWCDPSPLLKKSTVDCFSFHNINLTPQITAGAAAGWPAEASSARGCFAGAPGRHMRCSAASRRWRCRLRHLRCGSSSASSERSEPYAGLCFCFGALRMYISVALSL